MTEFVADVLVVGAGPVGLLCALELGALGVGVRIVDARDSRGDRSKATTIWPRQLELFARHGLAERVVAAGARLDRVTVSTPQRRLAVFELGELSTTVFPFGISLPQPQLEALLEEALRLRGVVVERSTTLTALRSDSQGAKVELAGPDGARGTASFRFVVGADGAHSTVRALADITASSTGPRLTFAITDVQVDGRMPSRDVAYYYSDIGALGIVPLGAGRYRLALGVPAGADALGREGFARALVERSGLSAELGELPWESHFEITFLHADTYFRGRAVLAGDAAHTMSPAGGQGMNTGLQDAASLGWRLADVLCVEDPAATAATLAGYTRERRADVAKVMRTSALLTRFGADRTAASRLTRELLAAVTRAAPSLRIQMTERIAQLATSYDHRPRLVSLGRRLRVGDRFPQGFTNDWSASRRVYAWLPAGSHGPPSVPATVLTPDVVPPAVARVLGGAPVTVTVRPDGHVERIDPATTAPPTARRRPATAASNQRGS